MPSLLRVNQASRKAAKEFYKSWCKQGWWIYIYQKCRDIFHFRKFDWNSFWFLRAVGEDKQGHSSSVEKPVLDQLKAKGIRKFAFDEKMFAHHLNLDWPLWLRAFDGIEVIMRVYHTAPKDVDRRFQTLAALDIDLRLNLGSPLEIFQKYSLDIITVLAYRPVLSVPDPDNNAWRENLVHKAELTLRLHGPLFSMPRS